MMASKQIDSAQAAKITDAIEVEPGLIVVTGWLGGNRVEVFGRRGFESFEGTFPATKEESAAANIRALTLASATQLPILIRFIPVGK